VRREAFERAVDAIGRRERSVAELTEWLTARGYAEEEVAETIERLIELGELDDERFARRYAEDKRELRGWGAERIRDALMQRGIDRDLIETALASESRLDQIDRAAGLLAGRGAVLDTEAERARALAFLARRGYELEVAYEAVTRRKREAA
jgi:regulatory protein